MAESNSWRKHSAGWRALSVISMLHGLATIPLGVFAVGNFPAYGWGSALAVLYLLLLGALTVRWLVSTVQLWRGQRRGLTWFHVLLLFVVSVAGGVLIVEVANYGGCASYAVQRSHTPYADLLHCRNAILEASFAFVAYLAVFIASILFFRDNRENRQRLTAVTS